MSKSVTILVSLLILFVAGVWYWQTNTVPPKQGPVDATPVMLTATSSVTEQTKEEDIANLYARYEPLRPMRIGDQAVQASIAATAEERKQGLSGTPELPGDVVKLFVFPTSGQWGFWMKDMNYAIDILWVNDAGRVVYVAPEVAPETYPESFTSPEPARYVIETVAGFAAQHDIVAGTEIVLPEQR